MSDAQPAPRWWRAFARAVWALVADEATGRLDVAQILFAMGLVLLSYGAHLAYHPAGFIVPGLVLLWWTLPPRPPMPPPKGQP